LGWLKILWHESADETQLGVFAKRVHIVFQEVGHFANAWGEFRGVVADSVIDGWRGSAFPRVVSTSAIGWAVVRCFLATILGTVSQDFAVEALVVLHKLLFLGFGVLHSSAAGGVNVHVISSLRGCAIIWSSWSSVV